MKRKQETLPTPVATNMTTEDKVHQYNTLNVYRTSKIIPSIQDTARNADVSTGTVIGFFSGNSTNDKMRIYLRRLFAANFKVLPDDIATLLTIWDRDTKK